MGRTNTVDGCIGICKEVPECIHYVWTRGSKDCHLVNLAKGAVANEVQRNPDKKTITGSCRASDCYMFNSGHHTTGMDTIISNKLGLSWSWY